MGAGTPAASTGDSYLGSSLTVAQLAVGSKARIVAIEGDRGLTRRFLALGLRVGSELTLSQTRRGGVVVICDRTRVALGLEMARHLVIEPVG